MQTYKSINSKKPSKTKRLITVIIIILILFFAAIWIIGAIAGSDSAENQNISAAVEENVRLKQEVSELKRQIEDMQAQIDGLNNDLSARPTIEPSPYAPVEEVAPR